MVKKLDEIQSLIKLTAESIARQKAKKFNYKIKDFEIQDFQWKHKDWKTWVKGANNYEDTKIMVEKYIKECKKPYGQRNLNFIHLI